MRGSSVRRGATWITCRRARGEKKKMFDMVAKKYNKTRLDFSPPFRNRISIHLPKPQSIYPNQGTGLGKLYKSAPSHIRKFGIGKFKFKEFLKF